MTVVVIVVVIFFTVIIVIKIITRIMCEYNNSGNRNNFGNNIYNNCDYHIDNDDKIMK